MSTKKSSKAIISAAAGLGLAALLIIGCQKEAPISSTTPPNVQPELRLSGDPFISISGAVEVSFNICGTGASLVTNPALAIPYNCACPSKTLVGVANGTGGGYCFTENTWYTLKATSGPSNRKTLQFKFPTNYTECTLHPATRFDYDAVTGTWSLGTAANGVTWSQSVMECTP